LRARLQAAALPIGPKAFGRAEYFDLPSSQKGNSDELGEVPSGARVSLKGYFLLEQSAASFRSFNEKGWNYSLLCLKA
jgi:hypothetical protein